MESPKRHILFRKPEKDEKKLVRTENTLDVPIWPERLLKPDRPVKSKPKPIPEPKSTRQYTHKIRTELRQHKAMCNKKGIPSTLTPKEFDDILSQPCYFCGDPGGSISLAEPNIGYVIENSLPCCEVCKVMKGDLPSHIFLQKIAHIGRTKEIFCK